MTHRVVITGCMIAHPCVDGDTSFQSSYGSPGLCDFFRLGCGGSVRPQRTFTQTVKIKNGDKTFAAVDSIYSIYCKSVLTIFFYFCCFRCIIMPLTGVIN